MEFGAGKKQNLVKSVSEEQQTEFGCWEPFDVLG